MMRGVWLSRRSDFPDWFATCGLRFNPGENEVFLHKRYATMMCDWIMKVKWKMIFIRYYCGGGCLFTAPLVVLWASPRKAVENKERRKTQTTKKLNSLLPVQSSLARFAAFTMTTVYERTLTEIADALGRGYLSKALKISPSQREKLNQLFDGSVCIFHTQPVHTP
jgi:hypothetical protein